MLLLLPIAHRPFPEIVARTSGCYGNIPNHFSDLDLLKTPILKRDAEPKISRNKFQLTNRLLYTFKSPFVWSKMKFMRLARSLDFEIQISGSPLWCFSPFPSPVMKFMRLARSLDFEIQISGSPLWCFSPFPSPVKSTLVVLPSPAVRGLKWKSSTASFASDVFQCTAWRRSHRSRLSNSAQLKTQNGGRKHHILAQLQG